MTGMPCKDPDFPDVFHILSRTSASSNAVDERAKMALTFGLLASRASIHSRYASTSSRHVNFSVLYASCTSAMVNSRRSIILSVELIGVPLNFNFASSFGLRRLEFLSMKSLLNNPAYS